jgi:amino acid adenylation domain-containing protein
MIPSAFVALSEMPVTNSGKTDRRALPTPDWNDMVGDGDFVAPRTPVEQQLATIWSELLSVARVGVGDSFFDLGGNSLLVLRLVSRVRSTFFIDLPLVAAFLSPTLGELAAEVETLQAAGRLPDLPPIERIPRDGPIIASFGQERFWFLQQLSPNSAILNMHDALPVSGELDIEALRNTVQEIVRRHEVMRTTFTMSAAGELMQVVSPEWQCGIAVEDLSQLPKPEQTKEVERRSQEEAGRPFDLTVEPPFRIRVLRLDEREHVLLITTHHIAHDGWSADVMIQEVGILYDAFHAGRPSPLPELAIQYADYAVWQRGYLQGERLESLLIYWREKLRGLEPLKLPTDRQRQIEPSRTEQAHNFMIPNRVKLRLQRLCSENGVTPFMFCLAAFQTLLHRYSDTDDIAVATPVANRMQPETQRMLGLFINTLVLRSDLSGDPSFRAILGLVRQTSIDAYDRQELPFERLVADLQPHRDLNIHPLAQVMLSFNQRTTSQRVEQRQDLKVGFQTTSITLEADEMFDLTLVLTDIEQGLHGQFTYDNGLFDDETIERMADHFQVLLEAVIENPDRRLSELPLLTDAERTQILNEWNQTDVEYADALCVQQLFETQAERTPHAVALVFQNQTTTYENLNVRANQLANHLLKCRVGPETPVGICLEPSPDMIVAILAILKAGGTYVPLDPDDPRERLDFILADSRPAVVLTTSRLKKAISVSDAHIVCLDSDRKTIDCESKIAPDCRIDGDCALCILYTSGSTGNPKGAVNLHRGVRNYLLWKREYLRHGPDDRILFATPLSFDVSVEEVFDALVCGGRMVIATADQKRDPSYLVRLMADEGVTTACFVPSILRVLLEDEQIEECRSLRSVLCGGEALHPDLMNRFFDRVNADLYNIYGPTEASMGVTAWKCEPGYPRGVIPIGQAISNVRIYILDEQRNPVPIGVAGELYIGGVAVARGYLNREDLNAEAFLPDLFSKGANDRLYRTGDRCRWLPDGNIEFLGRWDGQVKISGTRIELGEVEAAINRYEGIAHAAVVTRESAPGHKYLAAYVVPRHHRADDEAACETLTHDLRRFLKAFLPDYIMPQVFEVMDVLPQLPSGKVNRAALPAVAPVAAVRRYIPPRTPIEQQLAAICADVLKRDRIGIYDNFFESGGHSLLAVQMMVRIRVALTVELPVAVLFSAPTIAELAERIEAAQRGEVDPMVEEDEDDVAPERRVVDEFAANLLAPSMIQRSNHKTGSSVVPLRSGGSDTPLFCIHGLGGHIAGFLPLANALAEGRPVYGLQAQGLEPGQQPHDRIETMAEFYLDEIRDVQPHGPYLLVGWSLGGLIAIEIAQRIQATGETVAMVGMLDSYLSMARFQLLASRVDDRSVIRWLAPQLNLPVKELKKLPLDQQWERIAEAANLSDGIGVVEIRRLAEVCKAHLTAAARYKPQTYKDPIVLFQADMGRNGLDRRWKSLCPQLRVEPAPGDHYDMLRKPNVDRLAERLDEYIRTDVNASVMAENR